MKYDSSNDVPLRFENSFRSDPACYIAKYSKYKHCMKTLTRKAKSHGTHAIKTVTDFNVTNFVRRENKVVTLNTRYTVLT